MRTVLALFLICCCISLVNAAPSEKADLASQVATFESGGPVLEAQATGLKPSQAISGKTESVPDGDTYSLAPLLQDEELAYFMTDTQQATNNTYDQSWKTIGTNEYGTSGGKFRAMEKTTDLGGGVTQISVRVTAVNSQNNAEPWVDQAFAGSGFINWRLDVGTNFGGSNQIEPGSSFEIEASGVLIFDSAGTQLADLNITDTSDSNGLSGIALLNLTDDPDIAGFDVATILIYWNIKIEPDNPGTGFQVTGGQSGAWFDPSHSGEGYVLQIINETLAVIFWFTYDKNGNQVWIISTSGVINGSKITFDDLITTRGGKFGPEYDPDDVELVPWGTLEFEFIGCNNAIATYNGPAAFGSGALNVIRLSSIWGIDCAGKTTAVNGTGVGYLSPGFSGAWFDPSHNFEGFTVEILDEKTALVFWFTYDTEGNQAWMIMTAEIQGATILAIDVLITSGGKFGPNFDPDDVVAKRWGAAVFSFASCTQSGHGGSMRYLPPPEFGIESTQLLFRLIFIENLGCSFLSNVYDISGAMTVAENIFVDGDVNDPNVDEVPNDLDSPSAQQLVPPAKVAGFVSKDPTGEEGDRFETENDEYDVYILALREGDGVSLVISDWDTADTDSVDLDLYLFDVNDTDETADSSLTTNEVETVFAPQDGNYFVVVQAFAGQSNYLMQSGQSGQIPGNAINIAADFVPDQVMASVLDMNTLASAGERDEYRSRIEKAESKLGLTRIEESPGGDLLYKIDTSQTYRLVPHPLTLAGFGSSSPEEWLVVRVAKSLASNPDYNWAGPNYIYTTDVTTPNDPGYPIQWHYPLIRLPEAWDISRGSDQVVVAVVDSGVYNHPDLASNVDYALGYDFVADIFSAGDDDGIDSDARDPGETYPSTNSYLSHGTHVAGTVGARTNNGSGVAGIAWDVTIMPIRVLGVFGSGSCFDINEGLKWAGRISNTSGQLPSDRADIVNMSLGGNAPCSGQQSIINQLTSSGAIVVVAAGNEGTTSARYPAAFSNVVSVSATTLADELAYYSSYGSNTDIAAPGGDLTADLNDDSYVDGVLSPTMIIEKGSAQRQNSFNFLQGTSMAAPHVSGIAALMKSVYPGLGPSEFQTAIASGKITVDLAQDGETSKDPEFGYGRIDALEAVEWAVKAEQGQETDAFLTSSASALDFSSNQQTLDLIIEKAGTGNLAVSSIGWTESWTSVSSISTDQNGFGRYRVMVDRAGLIGGQYSGWVAFDADNGTRLWVSVLMRVGDAVQGNAAYVYALLLDQWTLQNVKTWHGPQINTGFDFDFNDLPPGTNYLMVSTDLDNDFAVCDDGELCELYPNNSEISGIVITNSDVQLGNFRMGFPTPDLKSAGDSGNAVLNSMDDNASVNSANQGPGKIVATRPRE